MERIKKARRPRSARATSPATPHALTAAVVHAGRSNQEVLVPSERREDHKSGNSQTARQGAVRVNRLDLLYNQFKYANRIALQDVLSGREPLLPNVDVPQLTPQQIASIAVLTEEAAERIFGKLMAPVLSSPNGVGAVIGVLDPKYLESLEVASLLRKFPELQAKYMEAYSTPDIDAVSELEKSLTQRLIGYALGVDERSVRAWLSGQHVIKRVNMARLNTLLTAVRLLLEVEKPKHVMRWLATTNPDLQGKEPAQVVREADDSAWLAWVVRSASAYVETGE